MILSSSWSAVSLLLTGLYALTAHAAVDKVNAVGSKFFYENGTQYYMKGRDPTALSESHRVYVTDYRQESPTSSSRKTLSLTRSNANVISLVWSSWALMPFVSTTSTPTLITEAAWTHLPLLVFICLSILTLLTLRSSRHVFQNVPSVSFNNERLTIVFQNQPSWTQRQFHRFTAVLDEFIKFDNTAGVFVGNEVITTKVGSEAAPFILAAARDIKIYRDHKGYRPVPVGYSAADIAELRPMLQNYLACSKEAADRLDFFGLNAYEWCGPSGYIQSGYSVLQQNASQYPIPIFFSETGCNTHRPRTFEDQPAIFGTEMAGTWSGSIVYEWIEETNNYGLISYGPKAENAAPTDTSLIQDGFTRKGTPTPVSPDFENLKKQWSTLHPKGVLLSEYAKATSTITPPECPSSTAGGWAVDPNSPLPTLGQTFTGGANGQHSATSTTESTESTHRTTASRARTTATTRSGTASAASATKESGSSHGADISFVLCVLVVVVALWL